MMVPNAEGAGNRGTVSLKSATQITPVPCRDHLSPSQTAQVVRLQGKFSDLIAYHIQARLYATGMVWDELKAMFDMGVIE